MPLFFGGSSQVEESSNGLFFEKKEEPIDFLEAEICSHVGIRACFRRILANHEIGIHEVCL